MLADFRCLQTYSASVRAHLSSVQADWNVLYEQIRTRPGTNGIYVRITEAVRSASSCAMTHLACCAWYCVECPKTAVAEFVHSLFDCDVP